jgi:hypothetical protein
MPNQRGQWWSALENKVSVDERYAMKVYGAYGIMAT